VPGQFHCQRRPVFSRQTADVVFNVLADRRPAVIEDDQQSMAEDGGSFRALLNQLGGSAHRRLEQAGVVAFVVPDPKFDWK
jgi:hypothetical protein